MARKPNIFITAVRAGHSALICSNSGWRGRQIYQNPGRQDLTADVNFTDLMKWSEPWIRDQRLQSFAAFLDGFLNPAAAADSHLSHESRRWSGIPRARSGVPG